MARKLSEEDKVRVRALMRLDERPGGGYWLWPTDASVKLERELSGALADSRARVAAMIANKDQEEPGDE